ncbi:ATP phosphoribosyltransferase regulatory subunit [Ectothiorhodospiraceae bacterium 2226]|nr:ATP phosphoribosyltransferase regulatory subunit [Ectothiorhodospiraceae bacterium 2226]
MSAYLPPDQDRWVLPAGIEEVLPPQAAQLEQARRQLLDLYASWGYELVMPPLIEYLDSLLTGTGNDLDLQTFKLIDQLSGRLMGVRADMTPQVARIDVHHLKREAPTRLCYLGTVLLARPDGFAGSRSPLQVGGELYGHAGPESDAEVLCLMIETLRAVGIAQPHVDVGHVGIYRALAQQAGLDPLAEARLFDALQRKALPELEADLAERGLDASLSAMLRALPQLNGGREVLAEARAALRAAGPAVQVALDNLEAIDALVRAQQPEVPLHFDLAELRGYHYHTGAVFAAFVPGVGQAVAQGGRYDDIGKVFGRARPATGFSADLKTLLQAAPPAPAAARGIFVPASDAAGLRARVQALRAQGERVVMGLPGQRGEPGELGCDRRLVQVGDDWQVVPLDSGR